jgi:hypothetical protein
LKLDYFRFLIGVFFCFGGVPLIRSKKTRKYVSLTFAFMIFGGLLPQNHASALTPVGDYDLPKSDELYTTDNKDIIPSDLLYTGPTKSVVRGAKLGALPDSVILRSRKSSSDGYTFYKPSELSSIASAINGNPGYVTQRAKLSTIYRTNGPSGSETWYWSRDIGRASGATVDLEPVPGFDKHGLPNVRVVFNASEKPKATLDFPSAIMVNDPVTITYSGEEFDPYEQQINWTLKTGSTVITEGDGIANQTGLKDVKYKFPSPGTYTVSLSITDRIDRTTTVSKKITVKPAIGPPPPPPDPSDPPPPPEPMVNTPPVADIYADPEFYWVETALWKDSSYDPDGEIASSEFTLDDTTTVGDSYKFPRVTEPEPHTVRVDVVDNQGATASDSTTFNILPTIPTANLLIGGTLKENREITLDATSSDLYSPVKVAPIDYSKTKWTITPVTAGIDPAGIKIRASSDLSKKELLVRQAGEYDVTVSVTNVYDEESVPLTKRMVIEPDQDPLAAFTVSTAKALRDKDDGNKASVTLKDQSSSPDGDKIKQRIYYMERDVNNDGLFGTVQDGGKKIISSDNETSITFKTSLLGHYRFSLEVIEDFGQPTLPEFITDVNYHRDSSNIIDSEGKVSTYEKPENFNLPSFDKYVEVDNVPPIIDFGVKRQAAIDIVLNFGGMDTATKKTKTGSRPGNGTNNGGGGGTYNHNYYDIDDSAKNQISAYAASLEADFRAKGIDAHVVIDNDYYRIIDTDGDCIQNIPVWGNVDNGYYSYSSYSGTSPYSGSWTVTSSSSSPIYGTVWCYSSYMDHGILVEHSHAPPCSEAGSAVSGQVGTQYTASLQKYNPSYSFQVTGYTSQGCSSEESVDTTDFTNAYKNQTYRSKAESLYFRMDNKQWTWGLNSLKMQSIIDKTKLSGINFWNNGDSSNKSFTEKIASEGSNKGQFTLYDPINLQSNVQKVKDYVLNKYMIEENKESFTIVLGDKVDYTTLYSDFENDPELKREWKFTHDPTKVNGRVIDNQPSSPIAQSGLYVDSPVDLTEVGTYKVILHAMDDPLKNGGGDARFANYRKWSDDEIVREYEIHVHRRPIADFTSTVEPGTLKLTLDPNTSYDPDHQYNRSDKGIIEYTWVKYVVNGQEFTGKPPANLQADTDYFVTLQVKDVDGAYGTVTKLITTKNVNLKPIALFDSPDVVLTNQALKILDRSYDPNGDTLTDYQITVRKSNSPTILKTLSSFPNTFDEMGLPAGSYTIGLTVKDIPKYPPQLQSDLFERQIKVVKNDPPVSLFTITPNPILVNKKAIYKDLSTDPNNDPLVNYSWTIDKLNASGEITDSWNTGSPPIDFSGYGVGKYRITQTLFDAPPSPLPSLKGESSIIVTVVQGPQEPFANFTFDPLIPTVGDTIKLDPDSSIDPDGTVVSWDWSIKAPNGTVTTSTAHYPSITNGQLGNYVVTLNVKDNDGLQSLLPAVQTITVKPKPPNLPPIAVFIWDPNQPFLGDTIKFNPDGSFDEDGTITSYQWTIKAQNGTTTTSSLRYPSITANSDYYDVTLKVTDNNGATASVSNRVNVNIAKLDGIVTHTPEWSKIWSAQGEGNDVNKFYAGEKFVIKLKSTPAAFVWGSVDFGGKIGKIDIPKESFKLLSTSPFEYQWEVELWDKDFESIKNGQYLFNFHSMHPVNSPYVQANHNYIINIVGNLYDSLKYHQAY